MYNIHHLTLTAIRGNIINKWQLPTEKPIETKHVGATAAVGAVQIFDDFQVVLVEGPAHQ